VWSEFDRLWSKRLKRDEIDCFHAVDFNGCGKEFRKFREDIARRHAFSSDLMTILKRHVFRKFGCVVVNESIRDDMSEEIKAENYITAYSLAGRVCVARLWEWMLFDRWTTAPRLIFEDGDIGKGMLRDGLLQDEFPEPIFKPKRDRTRKDNRVESGVIPLQAADWLAHESFLTAKTRSDDRWAMKEFLTTPGHLEILQAHDIKEIQGYLESSAALLKARFNELATGQG
jgi:hypothetical protein